MKKIYMILIISVVAFSLFAGNEINTLLEKAKTEYENRNFEEAQKLFLQVENSGLNNADLMYNIANTYFRNNNIVMAIVYYKKALHINPAHKRAFKDLKYALTMTQDKQELTQDRSLMGKIGSLYKSISVNKAVWSLIIVLALLVVLINLYILNWKNQDKAFHLFVIMVVAGLSLGMLIVTINKITTFNNYNEAVVKNQVQVGYSGPSTDFTRVFTVHEGFVVNILKNESGWSQVQLPNGTGGWIPDDSYIKVVNR